MAHPDTVEEVLPEQHQADVAKIDDYFAALGATEKTDETEEDAGQAESQQSSEGPDPLAALQHKYDTLQGMYNADAARAAEQNEALLARLAELEAAVAEKPAESQPVDEAPIITPDDVETFGADTVDLVRRGAQEEVRRVDTRLADLEQKLSSLTGEVVPKVSSLEAQQTQALSGSFWTQLTAKVPDWETINADPAFKEWLLEIDPLTGQARQVFLSAAQQEFDADRVAQFFLLWRQAHPAPKGADSAANLLSRQVAPAKEVSAGAPRSQEPRPFTSAEVTAFYNKVARGDFRGNEKEKRAIEAEIFRSLKSARKLA